MKSGDWTFFLKCSGTRPLLPYRAPAGRQTVAQGAPSGRSRWGALGHQSRHLFSLPQHVFCAGGEGSCEKIAFGA